MDDPKLGTDSMRCVIAIYQAMQKGWQPPTKVTEETYAAVSKDPHSDDPLVGFVKIPCSFGGKFNAGYARGVSDYAEVSARNLAKMKQGWGSQTEFACHDYLLREPKDELIYCDPPYQGTTGYKGTAAFDHAIFWDTMRLWSKNNIVVISEYKAPEDFRCVLEIPRRQGLRTTAGGSEIRVERLFRYGQA